MNKEQNERIEKIAFTLGIFQMAVDSMKNLEDTQVYKHSLKLHTNRAIKEMEKVLSVIDQHRFKKNVDTNAVNEEEIRIGKIVETVSLMILSIEPLHITSFTNDLELLYNKYKKQD